MRRSGAVKGILAAAFVAIALSGCATPPADPDAKAYYEQINDPLEPMNRGIFQFNLALDKVVLRPAAKAYEFALPDLIRDSIRNFLRNLKTPVTLLNEILQGDGDAAGKTMGRFMVNTFVGVGGLFDPASGAGLPYREEDFGQTLAVWGVKEGPYLMLPILGPSNVRDTSGIVADYFADPINHYASNTDRRWIPIARGTTEAVDTRSRNYKTLEDLERTSLDFYATVRSLYRQRRDIMIKNGNPDSTKPSPGISFDLETPQSIDGIQKVSVDQ